MLGGRGAGKIEGAERRDSRAGRRRPVAHCVVGPYRGKLRAVMVEGRSGTVAPQWNRPVFNPSLRRLTSPNGGCGDAVQRGRAGAAQRAQHDAAAIDELCASRKREAWDQVMFGCRLGGKAEVRDRHDQKALLAREGRDVVVSLSSSYDNRANLVPADRPKIPRHPALPTRTPGGATRRHAGALWRGVGLKELRLDTEPVFRRIFVTIEPNDTQAGRRDRDRGGSARSGRSRLCAR